MQAYVTLILDQVIGMYCPNSLTVWLLSTSVSGFLKLLSNTLFKKLDFSYEVKSFRLITEIRKKDKHEISVKN